ncbi:NOL9-like protein [Mya arenaria]|uniref:NOL9-like protein n=1 Tax=Mya arenaria TaxID=6604 RepID=A0ABY7G054_MYAAR|nr:NOL9-like protein [Mya arenaria]
MKGKKKNKLKGKPMPVKGNQETKLHVDLKLEKEPTAKKRKQSSEVENDEVSAARKKAKTASEMTKKNLKDMPVTDSKKEEKKKAKSAFEMTKKSEKHMPVTDLDKRRENKAKSAFEIRKKSVTETKNEELRLETAVSKNKKKKKKKSGKNSPAAVNRIEKNSPAAVNRNEKNSPAAVNRNEKNSPAAVNRNVERSRKSPRKQGMIKKTKEDKEASVATSRNDDTIESIWGRIMKGNKANSIKEMQGEKKDGGFTQVSESNKRSKQKGKVDNELAKTGSDVALSGNVNLVSEINEASETVGKGKKKRKKNQADAEDDTKVKKLKGSDKDISDKCFQGDFVLDNHNIASSSKDGAEMGPDVDEAIVDLSETSLTELDEISVKRPVALEFGKSVLVIMNHPMEVPIRGRARVCGIMGTATSMGYDIKPGKPAAEIYSPAIAPVMVVCGGKNSGKSTTNRILMNVSLNSVESLYYLECDIGQTEFTPSGVVALYRVTAPVIGLGWQLFVDTVRWVRPSHIVQLTSHNKHDNIDPLSFPKLNSYSWSDLSQKQPRLVYADEVVSTIGIHCKKRRKRLTRQNQGKF